MHDWNFLAVKSSSGIDYSWVARQLSPSLLLKVHHYLFCLLYFFNQLSIGLVFAGDFMYYYTYCNRIRERKVYVELLIPDDKSGLYPACARRMVFHC